MNYYYLTFFILIIFLKTGNVLSNENAFNVNNVEISKKTNISNEVIANKAIQKGFKDLINRILLNEDKTKLLKLDFNQIKNLVSYYQIVEKKENEFEEKILFNIFFDKEKIHDLFFQKGIYYSEISNKEFFLLPIFKKDGKIYVYNGNFFYEKWNEFSENDILEFVLPLEKIEIIQAINSKKNNLSDLNLNELFEEYSNKNLALVLIEDEKENTVKIYLKAIILGKEINKNIGVKKLSLKTEELNKIIIKKISDEIINTVKSENLVDLRTPLFLNTKFIIDRNNNFVELEKRIKKINLIDKIFVQEISKDYVLIKLKYLGKLENIKNKLEEQQILLKYENEQWLLRII